MNKAVNDSHIFSWMGGCFGHAAEIDIFPEYSEGSKLKLLKDLLKQQTTL